MNQWLDIKKGDTVVTEEMVGDGMATLPADCAVNVGVYAFCFSIDDDSISMREMKWSQRRKGQQT